MRSFFENVPPQYVPELRELIESLRETQGLIQQVRGHFGTDKPEELKKLMGQAFGDITVTEQSVEELEALQELHEERRSAIRAVFNRIAGKPPAPEAD